MGAIKLLAILTHLVIINNVSSLQRSWSCQSGNCIKQFVDDDVGAVGLAACRLLCHESGSIWPRPTGSFLIDYNLIAIDVTDVTFTYSTTVEQNKLFNPIIDLFKERLQNLIPNNRNISNGIPLHINVSIAHPEIDYLTLETSEQYGIQLSNGQISILSTTIFGFRHALETLLQIHIYDDVNDEILSLVATTITDEPAYPYRGILIDTSRNYVDIDTIKRTLDGMGATKLNRFHWHLTDSQSFPFVAPSRPELSQIGAYSSNKVYTADDIRELVEYAAIRGVSIIPELDAPAHVGEGWQNTGFIACFNAHPWGAYCGEPPCGQIDPTIDGVYDLLEDLYGDMLELFQPDIFHMGGDEVNTNCWDSTPSIVQWMEENQVNDYYQLWQIFQRRALERLYNRSPSEIPIMMWTNDLTTPQHLPSLSNETYIIQVWTTKTDETIPLLLNNSFRIVLSNYDALYLDCGFATWDSGDGNWCSPYKGWQTIYENTPASVAADTRYILGNEVASWSEQAGTASVDTRIWPRAAALAESVWSAPTTSWTRAHNRFVHVREKLIDLGINADTVAPEWCSQNEGQCFV